MTFAPSAHQHSGDPRQPDSAGGICVNHESVHSSGVTDPTPSLRNIYPLNQNAPIYLVEARFRTDSVTRIISRVKKARLFYRSFDSRESPRLSGSDAFEQVAQSNGVLLHLLPERISDAPIHNLQVA